MRPSRRSAYRRNDILSRLTSVLGQVKDSASQLVSQATAPATKGRPTTVPNAHCGCASLLGV